MGDVLGFVNGNQGALLFVIIIVQVWQIAEFRNMRAWIKSLQHDLRTHIEAGE